MVANPGSIPTLTTDKERTPWEQIENRLAVLRNELETGQVEFQKITNQQTYLQETLLRISGAIQVLEELLAERRNTPEFRNASCAVS